MAENTLHFHVPEHLLDRIDLMALDRGITRADWFREALRDNLSDLRDLGPSHLSQVTVKMLSTEMIETVKAKALASGVSVGEIVRRAAWEKLRADQ